MMNEKDSLTIESLLNMLHYGTPQEKSIAQAVIENVAENLKERNKKAVNNDETE